MGLAGSMSGSLHTARFMAPVTCGLTAEDREQLQTPYEGEEFGP